MSEPYTPEELLAFKQTREAFREHATTRMLATLAERDERVAALMADVIDASVALRESLRSAVPGHHDSCFADAVAIGPAGRAQIIEDGGDPDLMPQPCTCAREGFDGALNAFDAALAALGAALKGEKP